ncbi:hypothetical protein BD779DRAFT_1474169 [Infundibulicybe gibba]|nr:hypothetical protein BD779DRAFT_1474169 [Infundibulicybe gibba]
MITPFSSCEKDRMNIAGAIHWIGRVGNDGGELIVFFGLDEEVLEKELHNTLHISARAFLVSIPQKSKSHQLSPDYRQRLLIIHGYIPGRVTDTLDRLIVLYHSDSVVVDKDFASLDLKNAKIKRSFMCSGFWAARLWQGGK